MSSPKKRPSNSDVKKQEKPPEECRPKRQIFAKKFDDEEPHSSTSKTPLKLTLKIGGQTLSEKSVIKSVIAAGSKEENEYDNDNDFNEFGEEEDDDGEVMEQDLDEQVKDEEDEWLDALEEGRLHEVDDELKKIRDPKLMTARQRALLENKSLKKKEEALKLASQRQSQSDEMVSEEMIQRKMLKARRRRQQAEEKKEKDKKQTIERLLRKKQEAARIKKKKKQEVPLITYKNNRDGVFICVPEHVQLEVLPNSGLPRENPSPVSSLSPVKCGRDGCSNMKKYSCSETKIPLCSLECYKQIRQHQQAQLSVT